MMIRAHDLKPGDTFRMRGCVYKVKSAGGYVCYCRDESTCKQKMFMSNRSKELVELVKAKERVIIKPPVEPVAAPMVRPPAEYSNKQW